MSDRTIHRPARRIDQPDEYGVDHDCLPLILAARGDRQAWWLPGRKYWHDRVLGYRYAPAGLYLVRQVGRPGRGPVRIGDGYRYMDPLWEGRFTKASLTTHAQTIAAHLGVADGDVMALGCRATIVFDTKTARHSAEPNVKEMDMSKKKHPVEVVPGQTYRATVRGKVTIARAEGPHPSGGWNVTNLATGTKHRISSAKGFLCRCDANGKAVEAAKASGKAKAKKTPKAKVVKKATSKTPQEAKPKRASGLDAAAAILAQAGKPMNTKDIVEKMLAKGSWKTNGKTPAATIYAAIIREIAAKGGQSRFRKADRGMFELTKVGKED